MRQDAVKTDQANLLLEDRKQSFKRLKFLGVMGHQPAVKINCLVSKQVQEQTEIAIFEQKYGTTSAQAKALQEHKERNDAQELITLKLARIDKRSCPKWKRSEVNDDARDENSGVLDTLDDNADRERGSSK